MSTVQGRTLREHHKTTPAAHSTSEFYLEVARGKTAHPIRPITNDRFLIGAGDWCDLCLGGDRVPVLHSVIHLDGEHAWIDAVSPDADLKVNGAATSFAELEPGDLIEASGIALKFGQRHGVLKHSSKSLYEPIPTEAFNEEDVDLSEMSASELVDLIECDMELVEEFERRKRRGTEALLDAVKRHRPAAQPKSVPQEKRSAKPAIAATAAAVTIEPNVERLAGLFQELKGTIESIGQFAQDLERRSMSMSPQQVNVAAASLLEFQEQVVGRLDEVLAKVAEQTKPSVRQPRKREAA